MPPEPSVTSACVRPRSCTLRYWSALLAKSCERPGPKSVSPATYCSGVKVVVWWRWIVDMCAPYLGGVTPFIALTSKQGIAMVDSPGRGDRAACDSKPQVNG